MRKNKILYFIIILSLLAFCYSCEKKEPAAQPDPNEIMQKITEKFSESDVKYDSAEKSKKLSESDADDIYSGDKSNPVDLSKIEKYSIIKSDENSANEIGIFKLYDKTNSDYVKKMAQARISKMQGSDTSTAISDIFNDAEIRSYGNYVYYVSHPQKDKIFEIIEDTLRGA